MKKTLIALAALAGVACAADTTTYVMDTAFTVDGDNGSAVSAILSSFANPYVNVNRLVHSGFSTTLTLNKMYGADVIPALQDGETLVLTSVQVISRNDTAERPADAMITLGGNLGTSGVADYSALDGGNRGLITFNFETPVEITDLETLTLTFTGSGKGFGYTCWQGAEGATIESDTPTFSPWHMPIRLNVAKVAAPTPEPATATLSLLALAGLVARRKRH